MFTRLLVPLDLMPFAELRGFYRRLHVRAQRMLEPAGRSPVMLVK